MTTLAYASGTSTASPAAFFARWADMATWTEWNTDTEWVRLDGPFVQGATGQLKPKGGPKVGFVVEKLTDTDFVDVSKLVGARLTFAHHIVATGTGSRLEITGQPDRPPAPALDPHARQGPQGLVAARPRPAGAPRGGRQTSAA